MSDILTRLLLNTSDYDSKLAKAKKSTQDYGKGLGDTANKVIGGFSKMAGAIGIAMGGMEAFNKVVSSSQTAGDKYAETMAGMKRGVDEFFTALGTGDFSAFNSGLDGMVARAREAYRALDQLGNAQMSFDIAQAMAQRSIQEGQLAAKNKFAPIDVAVGGFDTWRSGINDMTEKVTQLTSDTQEYIRKAVESVAGVKGFSANMDNITKGLLLDIQEKGKRSQLKAKYEKEYKEYIEAVEDASDLLLAGGKTEAQRMHDTRKYNERLAALNEKYNEAITVNALLVKYGDDELKAIGGNVKSMIGLDSSISNLKREFNETAYEFNNRNKGVAGFTPIESFDGYKVYAGPSASPVKTGGGASGGAAEAVAGSLAALDAEIKKAQQEYANTASDAARQAAMKTIQELQNKKGLIELHARVSMPSVGDGKSGSLAALAGGLPTTLGNLPLPDFKKKAEEIEEMNSALASTGDIFGSVGSIMSSFGNDMGAWIMNSIGSVAEMIVQLQSLTTARGVAEAASKPFPFNLAAMATVVATVASIFSSLPKFADGGVVGGSSYFGDKLLARVNSGEMILNQGQQARLLNMTEGGNVRVTGDVRLSGKDIYISLRNYMAASGNKL